MENFTWLLVSRMFIPLVEPVQPHNWEVFEWSPEFWARMGAKPEGNTGKATHPAKPVCPVPAAQPVDHVEPLPTTDQAGQDGDDIGVFEL